MEVIQLMKPQNVALIVIFLSHFFVSSVKGQTGQISSPCTAAMISGFTPCMDFITGSTADGSSPTSECCDAFQSLMTSSIDCGCLLVTASASVPLSLGYIKRNLALSLPKLCGSKDSSLQCQASPSPASSPADPMQLGAPVPLGSVLSPPGSKTRDSTPTADEQSDASPPAVADTPSAASLFGPEPSASSPSMISSRTFWLILMGFSLFKFL